MTAFQAVKGVLCDAKEQENKSLYTRRNKYFPF